MTVIAAFAPTELGRTVSDVAAHEAARRKTDLVLLNSATGAAYADQGLATEAELEAATASATRLGVAVTVRQVRDALTVAETVLDEAERLNAELVVVGLRNRSRTGKFLLGSTAQTVLLRSPCDVLAVRPRSSHHPTAPEDGHER